MSVPTSQTLQRITEVAKLRVEGIAWAQIATRYGYENQDSARTTLTQMHHEQWREAYERARELYLDEVESEATLTQRALLRSQSEQIRQSAGHNLLHHCRQLRAKKIELSGALRHDVTQKTLTPEEAVAAIKEEYERRKGPLPATSTAKDPNGDQP
jgi:hypothetical protein